MRREGNREAHTDIKGVEGGRKGWRGAGRDGGRQRRGGGRLGEVKEGSWRDRGR